MTASSGTTVSNLASPGRAVVRPTGGVTIVGRILAVLLPGRIAVQAPNATAAPSAPAAVTQGGNVNNTVDAAMATFFASQRCPLPLGNGSAFASELDALPPRCVDAATPALCGACLADAEAALLRAAWSSLPSLPPGALADAGAQAACGCAVVDALLARGVPAARLRDAGGECGDFAARPQCAVRDMEALAQPLLLACRDALTAVFQFVATATDASADAASLAAAFNATSAAYCSRCYWPSLALILNAAPLSDTFWCTVSRISWTAPDANARFFNMLLSERAFGACVRNMQALSRRLLMVDVLIDARTQAHQGRCWDAAFQPKFGTGLLSDATRSRVSHLACGAAPTPAPPR